MAAKFKENNKTFWEITKKGNEKKENLVEKFNQCLPDKNYKIVKSKNLVIVSFDIPEKERVKRNWLRNVLIKFNFKMLQKSVWVGRVKFPGEFISDLEDYKLLNYVQIFSVNKLGTIKSLV